MISQVDNEVLRLLTRCLGQPRIRANANEADFKCPRCPIGKKPKLGVNLATWKFHCFRCGYSGRVRYLLNTFGIDPPQLRVKSEYPAEHGLVKRDIPGFQKLNQDSEVGRAAYDLAVKRALLSAKDLDTKGWGLSTDPRLAGRLIIPIYDDRGYLVQYAARAVWEEQEPKELFGSDADGWAPKGDIAYNLYPPRPETPVVLVEGIWDVETVQPAVPDRWVLGLLGSYMSDVVLGKILAYRPPEITLFMDGDGAGRDATKKILRKLGRRSVPRVTVVRCPGDKDPADLLGSQVRELINNRIPGYLVR